MSSDAMDALTGLAAALGAADHPLVTCIGEAVARELVEASAIRHMAKAIRKKKHGPEYYLQKWQKKVQYAIDLAAWQEEQEQVQLQSEETSNAQTSSSENNGVEASSSVIDPSTPLNKVATTSTDDVAPTQEETSNQNDSNEGCHHLSIDQGASANDSVLKDPTPAPPPPPPPKNAPSPRDRRRSEAFVAHLLSGGLLASSQKLEQDGESEQQATFTSTGSAGHASVKKEEEEQEQEREEQQQEEQEQEREEEEEEVGAEHREQQAAQSQPPPPPPPPPKMDPTDRQRRASDEFLAHMQMIACVINAQRQVRGWCARRKAEKLRASNLKTTESMLDLLQKSFTHHHQREQNKSLAAVSGGGGGGGGGGETGKESLDLHATVAALQQENMMQRDKASHDAATIAELQAQILSLQERADEIVSTSEKNCQELEALHKRKVERLQRLLEEEIRRADSLVTQVDHLLQEQATQRRQHDDERRQRDLQARAQLTQDQEKIDQQAQLIESQQRQLNRQQRQLDALRKQTQELEEENDILHGHQKTAQQQIQQLLKQRQTPLPSSDATSSASGFLSRQRRGGDEQLVGSSDVDLSTRVAELEATVRMLTQTTQHTMPGPEWNFSGAEPHSRTTDTQAHAQQPRGRLW